MAWLPVIAIAKPSAEISAREYQVKAAYLYRFLGFIHAPATSGAVQSSESNSYSIAIIGKDPFGASFKPVEGRAIPGRNALVRVDRFPTAPPS